MPIKSKAQRRKFAELLVNGEISPEVYERVESRGRQRRVAGASAPQGRAVEAQDARRSARPGPRRVSRRPRAGQRASVVDSLLSGAAAPLTLVGRTSFGSRRPVRRLEGPFTTHRIQFSGRIRRLLWIRATCSGPSRRVLRRRRRLEADATSEQGAAPLKLGRATLSTVLITEWIPANREAPLDSRQSAGLPERPIARRMTPKRKSTIEAAPRERRQLQGIVSAEPAPQR